MAPPKGSKKPPKSMEKPLAKPISKVKKMKKMNYLNFSIYIYKLLKTVTNGTIGISRYSMLIMNNFVNDMLERIAAEAGSLVTHGKSSTLSSREVQTAVRLLVPGQLATHANLESLKAVSRYHKSQEK